MTGWDFGSDNRLTCSKDDPATTDAVLLVVALTPEPFRATLTDETISHIKGYKSLFAHEKAVIMIRATYASYGSGVTTF